MYVRIQLIQTLGGRKQCPFIILSEPSILFHFEQFFSQNTYNTASRIKKELQAHKTVEHFFAKVEKVENCNIWEILNTAS